MGNRNLVKEIVNDILRVNGSAETVGIIDTNLAIDHAIALSSRFRVLYWLANVGAFPVLQDQISGDGFKEITKVEDIGHVLENSDFILITDCYFGRLADYLRSQGVPVFGAPYEWTRIENDRVYGWKRLKEMGVGVPNGVILRGIDAVRKYIKENEREGRVFYLKVSKYRGNRETGGGVLNEVEALVSLSQAGFGPYLDDLEILVQEKCPGEEIGFDCFVNGKDFIRPFLYTIEIKGEGTLGVWTEKNGIEDHIFKKIKQSLVDTDYRGNISMEFFWDGSRVYVHDPTCFSEDTEVLTDNGWKFFYELEGNELIATLNPETFNIEFQKPVKYIVKEYVGDLIRIHGKRNFDLLVTPDHRLYVKKSRHKEYSFVEAKNIPGGCSIPRTGKWNGTLKNKFIIKGVTRFWKSGNNYSIEKSHKYDSIEIPMENWAKFLGIFLAEGNCGVDANIQITQMKDGVIKKIRELLDSIGIKYSYHKHSFRFRNLLLWNYLKRFGKQNERFVPGEIKESTPEIINSFLDYYCLGDGYVKPNGSRMFFTTSRRLADDIQELLLKVGSVGCIFKSAVKGTSFKIRGKEYTRNFDVYVVRESKKKVEFYIDKGRYGHIQKINYRGKVYCVTVPNSIIYVRRNGKPTWSGNCRLPFPCSAIQAHFIKNYPDVVQKVANGQDVRCIVGSEKYVAQVGVYTDDIESWRVIRFPEELRNRVGFRRVVKRNGDYYYVPGDYLVATALGDGKTPEKAVRSALDVASQIECSNTYIPARFEMDVLEVVRKLNKLGGGFEF